MNIAIVFVGELRWFDITKRTFIANFLPALEGHEIKYFAHFWPSEGRHLEILEEFQCLYKPLTYEVEFQKSPQYIQGIFENQNLLNSTLQSQSFSFYKAFLLLKEYQLKNNTTFDLYIKMRTDLAFIDKVDINTFDNTQIYTKNISHWRPLSTYVSDYIFFTKNFDNVKKLAKMGFYFDQLISKPEEFLYQNDYKNNIFCPEELLAKYIALQQIESKTFDFNIDLARHHR
jgi:hypothetical protein